MKKPIDLQTEYHLGSLQGDNYQKKKRGALIILQLKCFDIRA